MSCLPEDALSHFERREQELLALNRDLERKRAQVVGEASSALQGAAASAATTPQGQPSPLGASLAKAASGSTAGAPIIEVPVDPQPRSRPPTAPGTPMAVSMGGGEAHQTTVKMQSARIAALQEELERVKKDLAARDAEVQELTIEKKTSQDDVIKLQKSNAAALQKNDALKAQATSAEARVKDLEREAADMQKEKSQMEVQLRRSEADASAKEARLNRLTEECEKNKIALKDAGAVGRDQSTADRREMDRLQGEVRKLERQRSELVSAFKKQMKLIEVLKRQRAHMEAARVLSFTEEEFIRVLELGDRLGDK